MQTFVHSNMLTDAMFHHAKYTLVEFGSSNMQKGTARGSKHVVGNVCNARARTHEREHMVFSSRGERKTMRIPAW